MIKWLRTNLALITFLGGIAIVVIPFTLRSMIKGYYAFSYPYVVLACERTMTRHLGVEYKSDMQTLLNDAILFLDDKPPVLALDKSFNEYLKSVPPPADWNVPTESNAKQ